jgi:hypothetical protein
MKLSKRLWTLVVALLLGSFASAQALEELLPAETLLAVGVQDFEGASEYLDDFVTEWERLEVGQALADLFAAGSEEFDEEDAETEEGEEAAAAEALLEPLANLDLQTFVERDAWLAVSVSQFNPLPAFTFLSRLSPEALPQVQAQLEQSLQEAGARAQELTEGAYTFHQVALEDPDEFIQAISVSLVDDLLVVSTNPDVLRGVLRRVGGSEDGFATTPTYAATLGTLETGNFYVFLSYAQIQQAALPFAQGLGMDALVNRLSQLFTTASAVGSVSRVTPEGVTSESVQVLDVAGGDAALHTLLTQRAAATRDTVRFVPADALSYSSSHVDLNSWWSYLNSLASSVPELGGDLDTLLASFAGVSLRDTFFAWTEPQVSTISTGFGDVTQPGMPSENLLGESVYLIATQDEAAASAGLGQLFQTVSTMLAAFGDPTGGTGSASTTQTDVGGVSVTSFAITPGVNISYAVTDGYALIATSEDAMREVLAAQQGGSSLAEQIAFTTMMQRVPDDAVSFTYSDAGATMEATAEQIATQAQTMVGLGGASQLDFDRTTEAADTLQQFLQFVASRLESSISYTVAEGDSLFTYSEVEVAW